MRDLALALFAGLALTGLGWRERCRRALRVELAHAVAHVIHDVDPAHPVRLEGGPGLRVRLGVHRDEHVRACDFLLAGRLHVRERARQDALKPE